MVGVSSVMLPRHQPNFKVIQSFQQLISRLRDFVRFYDEMSYAITNRYPGFWARYFVVRAHVIHGNSYCLPKAAGCLHNLPTVKAVQGDCGRVHTNPDSKVHGANLGPIWGRQVGPMLASWTLLSGKANYSKYQDELPVIKSWVTDLQIFITSFWPEIFQW